MVQEQQILALGKKVLHCRHEMEQVTLQQGHQASSSYATGCLDQQQLEHALLPAALEIRVSAAENLRLAS